MKRLYTIAEYWEMLHRTRERVPGVAVSSDFIVGFCGETEASFAKTMRLVEDARFKNSFIFKYSERPGTKAAERFPDDIPEDVKRRRNQDLLAVQNANSLADHRQWIGREVRVLVEGLSRQGEKATGPIRQLLGRSLTDHIVVFDGPLRLAGSFLTVDVTDASPFTLYGTVRTAETQGATGDFTAPTRAKRVGLQVV